MDSAQVGVKRKKMPGANSRGRHAQRYLLSLVMILCEMTLRENFNNKMGFTRM